MPLVTTIQLLSTTTISNNNRNITLTIAKCKVRPILTFIQQMALKTMAQPMISLFKAPLLVVLTINDSKILKELVSPLQVWERAWMRWLSSRKSLKKYRNWWLKGRTLRIWSLIASFGALSSEVVPRPWKRAQQGWIHLFIRWLTKTRLILVTCFEVWPF